MSEKCLLDQWRGMAYDQTLSKDQLEKFWANYFLIEKEIYEKLLADPDTVVKGTVKELAENILISTVIRQSQHTPHTAVKKVYTYTGSGAHPITRCAPPTNSQKTAKVDLSFCECHTSIR